jgi:enamine deaminase RidA (YjgF/YER057c/UK114 family)
MSNPIIYLNPESLARPSGFTHVTEGPADRLIFISGQIACDADGKVVGAGDIAAQARQVFGNLGKALEAAGSGFDRVLKLTTFVCNISPEATAAIRAVRKDFLDEEALPASTLIGVAGLARPELLLEIEAIAVKRDAR